jgi:hypothetical protein
MPKMIMFCADGTWNNPYEDENQDHAPDPTNVYKLFTGLDGALSPDSLLLADEQEKELAEAGSTTRVAKHLHGVGDSRNPIIKLMVGAFGAGIISRIVRGYTFISRNFAPGDRIVILGFSRGAYTARALAGLIASQDLLSTALTADKEQAYRCGAEAWYRGRMAVVTNLFSLAHLDEIVTDLPAFLSRDSLRDSDLVPVDQITAVGVWDTVGAMGFPDYTAGGQRVDAFKFADTKLSAKVQHGFHAVDLDERRNDFSPTLWDPEDRIVQMLFPGAHSDVGGGYPAGNRESGLSNGALKWMRGRLGGWDPGRCRRYGPSALVPRALDPARYTPRSPSFPQDLAGGSLHRRAPIRRCRGGRTRHRARPLQSDQPALKPPIIDWSHLLQMKDFCVGERPLSPMAPWTQPAGGPSWNQPTGLPRSRAPQRLPARRSWMRALFTQENHPWQSK